MPILADNHALRKFFRANARFAPQIRHNLQQHLPELLQAQSYKIKIVAELHYQGQTIYEYKIPLDKNTSCRVAYIHQEGDICVFFISTTIVKAEFVKLLAKVQGVSR